MLTRPIIPGDTVELRTSTGATVMKGQVTRFDFLRTTIRLDNEQPILIPNKLFADYMIVNDTLKAMYTSQFNMQMQVEVVYDLDKKHSKALDDSKIDIVE